MVLATFTLSLLPINTLIADNGNGGCEDCTPKEVFALIAGQNEVVGTVTVENDEDEICVTYALDKDALAKGWGIYETHLAIEDKLEDIPQTREGRWGTNPIPGQFLYGDDDLDGVEEWTHCVSLDDLEIKPCDYVHIAAHAVVKRIVGYGDAISATIYGHIGGYTGSGPQGDIYEIDPLTRNETLIFNNPSTNFAADWYPNALAYDEDNHRLYFTTGQNRLEFYDFTSADDSSALTVAANGSPYFKNSDNVLGAAFGNGAYWYVLNRSEKLYRVDFDANGIATGRTEYVMTNDNKKLTQGDIVFLEDGKIFGSSGTGASPAGGFRGFFTYEIDNPNSFEIVWEGDSSFLAPQLAWGLDADGEIVMYGTNQQNIWTIDTETGVMTPVTKVDDEEGSWVTDYRYQDLASGFEYEKKWENETAWGQGKRFNERGNWGMYFNYTVCPPEECVPASTIFGVMGDGNNGSLWRIDVSDDSIVDETRLVEIDTVDGSTQFYPNGLAYDDENHRLYYAVRSNSGTQLFMYDFENDPILAATGLSGEVYGATWGDGKYWYIPNGSNDMRTVEFDVDGINGTVEMHEANFAGGKSFNFGDMALAPDEPVIYVSTSFSGTDKEFFKYDLNEGEGNRYLPIIDSDYTGKAVGLQLGFGEDGVLYGHNTFGSSQTGAGAKEWFEVSKAGTVTSLGTGKNEYNDLASGPLTCVLEQKRQKTSRTTQKTSRYGSFFVV